MFSNEILKFSIVKDMLNLQNSRYSRKLYVCIFFLIIEIKWSIKDLILNLISLISFEEGKIKIFK